MTEQAEYFCRVCGYIDKRMHPRWITHDNGIEATYDVCDSCGADSGADDDTLEAVRSRRQKWLASGPAWSNTGFSNPPDDWNPVEQMKHIPPEWR